MVQAGDGPRFSLEPFAPFWLIREMRRQNLDRDDAVETGVARAVHLTHSSRAYSGEDFVRAQTLAREDRHGLLLISDQVEYNSAKYLHTCKFLRDTTGGQWGVIQLVARSASESAGLFPGAPGFGQKAEAMSERSGRLPTPSRFAIL